jgi:phage terminase Nu1 subunit (DNA packaging protein)
VNSSDPAPRAANTTPSISSGWSGFLNKERAAWWASVSVRTLDRWIQRGLPVYRSGPGTKPLLRPNDIEQWLCRQERPQPDLNRMIDEVMVGLAKTTATRRTTASKQEEGPHEP